MARHKSKVAKLLSEKIPGERKIKRKYRPSLNEAKYWFAVINREIFGNVLEMPEIEIKCVYGGWGAYDFYKEGYDKNIKPVKIRLNNYFRSKKHFVHTFIHEMIHHYQYTTTDRNPNNVHHGESFQEWLPKLVKFNYKPYAFNLHKEEV